MEVVKAFRELISQHGLDCPVFEVGCMGHCYAEPLVIIGKPGFSPVCYHHVNPVIAERLVTEYIMGDDPCPEFVLAALEPNDMLPSFADFPRAAIEKKLVLRNCGFIDPENIDHAIANGVYEALATALKTSPPEIIDEIDRSGLRGRGGAGFPTGHKWRTACAVNSPVKYVICNEIGRAHV